MFGLETGDIHRIAAEAIVDTALGRRGVEDVARGDAWVVQDLLHRTAKNLEHAENHTLLLGRKTSLERVATFLIEMDRRPTSWSFP
jgi:CRP/FNR family nitrogen fixation transcriptional regulator